MNRNTLIKAIHTAKRALGLDEATYRALLEQCSTKNSCSNMTDNELERALSSLRKAGFSPKYTGETALMIKMVRTLWLQMHDFGIVHDPSLHAMDAFCLRQVKRVAAQCTVKQLQVVIESLKKWWERADSVEVCTALQNTLAGRSPKPALES